MIPAFKKWRLNVSQTDREMGNKSEKKPLVVSRRWKRLEKAP